MRVGWLCSAPCCRRHTVGSNSDGSGEVDVGVAAHITAAAPGGPRYDTSLTSEQRKSAANGIWLCAVHARVVDSDPKYTVQVLHQWKADAQSDSWRRLHNSESPQGYVPQPESEEEPNTRVRAAAEADLEVFRRHKRYKADSVALTVHVEGINEPMPASRLATALTRLGDIIMVAPPGVGKTTTLFQVAEALHGSGQAIPFVVPLGDWSTEGTSLIDSILKNRPAFEEVKKRDLKAVAANRRVYLLLDGWNELDGSSRNRARVEIERLQAEYELGVLITTRQQALDVPIDGKRVVLQPLSEDQQFEIATELRGQDGVQLLERARATPGLSGLVTIPLYLNALLTSFKNGAFPTTKEAVLKLVITAHEEDSQHIEKVGHVTAHLHAQYLEGLAVAAIGMSSSALSEANARKSISRTSDALLSQGQIVEAPQPNEVLEALVNHHVLIGHPESAGYSFPHQQIQEWYGSGYVENLMCESDGDATTWRKLKKEILNRREWEEAILFACERLARGNKKQHYVCASALRAAFDVDPMLAAEMISRSTDAVWNIVGCQIRKRVASWHTPGTPDRALRFMIHSGRPEFRDFVWPLITNKDQDVRHTAFNAGRQFRVSILGSDARNQIERLPVAVRSSVVQEIGVHWQHGRV